jgi:hypothetical protein
MNKPTGRYKCMACGTECDGSELYLDPSTIRWTCSDVFCGANVRKVADAQPEQEPKQDTAGATGAWDWKQIGLPKKSKKERYGHK